MTVKETIKDANGDKTKLRLLAEALVDKALTGDVPALKEVADRLDGKAVAQHEVSGPDGGVIPLVITPIEDKF